MITHLIAQGKELDLSKWSRKTQDDELCLTCLALCQETVHQISIRLTSENPLWSVHRAKSRATIEYYKGVRA